MIDYITGVFIIEQTFEAVWNHGQIIPKESVDFEENTQFKIIVLADQVKPENDW